MYLSRVRRWLEWVMVDQTQLNFLIYGACCEAAVDGGYSFGIWFLRHKAMVLRERQTYISQSSLPCTAFHRKQLVKSQCFRERERERERERDEVMDKERISGLLGSTEWDTMVSFSFFFLISMDFFFYFSKILIIYIYSCFFFFLILIFFFFDW